MGLNQLKAVDDHLLTEIEILYNQGWVLIPQNNKRKHPSYEYSHLMKSKEKLELSKIRGLFKSYGRSDRGLRLAGLRFEEKKNKKPTHQLVCLDIENDSQKISAESIYSAITSKVPEVSEITYVEKTPSGGYHIFFLVPYAEDNLVKTRALAYDANGSDRKLLAEILGFNRTGFSVGLGFDETYAPFYANTSITDLDSELPEDIIERMLEAVSEFNEFDFRHDISQIDESLISDEQFEIIKKTYNLSPLTEFNEHPESFKVIVEALTDAGYVHTSDRESGEDVISLFKHETSKHNHTLSVHNGHKTIWNYSTSDTIFKQNVSYRFSDVLTILSFDGNFVKAADFMNRKYGVGVRTGIPSEFKFYDVITTIKDDRREIAVKLNASVYSMFLEYLGYRAFATTNGTEIARIHENIVYRGILLEDIRRHVMDILNKEMPKPTQLEQLNLIKHSLQTNRSFFSSKTFYQSLALIEESPKGISKIIGNNSHVKTLESNAKSSFHCFRDCIIEIKKGDPFNWIIHEYKFTDQFIYDSQIINFRLFKDSSDVVEGMKYKANVSDFKEFKFLNFTFDIIDNKYDRWKQLMASLGFMLYTYKDPREARAVVLMDAQREKDNAVIGRKSGRTGKSLLMNFLKNVTNPGSGYVVPLDGVSLRESHEFSFGNIKPQTKIIAVDDLNSSYAMPSLYTSITGDMRVNAKFVQHKDIPFEDSPKIIISSNYMIVDDSPSTRKRVFQNYLHHTFNDTYTPFDKYQEMFFAHGDTTWGVDKQRLLHKLALFAVSMYFQFGVVRADEDIEKRRRSESFMYLYMADFLTKAVRKEFESTYNPLDKDANKLHRLVCKNDRLILPFDGHNQMRLDKIELSRKYREECLDEAREFKRSAVVLARFVDFFNSKGIDYSDVKRSTMKFRVNEIDLNMFDLGFTFHYDKDDKLVAKRKQYE